MIHNCKRERITVVQMGLLETSAVYNALSCANELQQAFYFDVESIEKNKWPLDEKYELPNHAFDLCGAVEDALVGTEKYRKLPRPLLIISEKALGDPDHPTDPDYVWSNSQETDYDPSVSIISTYTAGELPNRTFEAYLFMLLSTHIFSVYGDISYHPELRGCPLDYCEEWSQVENCFNVGKLCDLCDVKIQNRVGRHEMSIERVAAAVRLLNQAAGRKYCFVVMPFSKELNLAYDAVRKALIEQDWEVRRADEIPRGNIDEVVLKEILTSDLAIADLTGANPNVLYEVGLIHALGNAVILLTQEKRLPINLSHAQTVFYDMDQLDELKRSLQRRLPRGKTR